MCSPRRDTESASVLVAVSIRPGHIMTMQLWLLLDRAGVQAPAASAGQAEAGVVRSQGRQRTQDDGRHLRRRQWSRL